MNHILFKIKLKVLLIFVWMNFLEKWFFSSRISNWEDISRLRNYEKWSLARVRAVGNQWEWNVNSTSWESPLNCERHVNVERARANFTVSVEYSSHTSVVFPLTFSQSPNLTFILSFQSCILSPQHSFLHLPLYFTFYWASFYFSNSFSSSLLSH